MNTDVLILGGGIVGSATALELQRRGRSVVLVDLREPGAETSFGNAGIVQSEAYMPYPFPRKFSAILKYSLNRSVDVHYHFDALIKLLVPFARYWRESSPERLLEIAIARAPLIARSVQDHLRLAAEVGADDLYHATGFLHAYRKDVTLRAGWQDYEQLRRNFGVPFRVLDASALHRLEPSIGQGFIAAMHLTSALTVRDPGDLVQRYADRIVSNNGIVAIGDARHLREVGARYSLMTSVGEVTATDVVVSLGPWSLPLAKQFGCSQPLFPKRGYHLHFSPENGATLGRPLADADGGYVLAPMKRGIRLITGAEFARIDAPATPVQIRRAEPLARKAFPHLGAAIDGEPWLGARPCLPDMLPVIGEGKRRGVWYAFGHAHQGFTMGPTTGLLLAQMMTGEAPFTDPAPYRPDRFFGGRPTVRLTPTFQTALTLGQ